MSELHIHCTEVDRVLLRYDTENPWTQLQNWSLCILNTSFHFLFHAILSAVSKLQQEMSPGTTPSKLPFPSWQAWNSLGSTTLCSQGVIVPTHYEQRSMGWHKGSEEITALRHDPALLGMSLETYLECQGQGLVQKKIWQEQLKRGQGEASICLM